MNKFSANSINLLGLLLLLINGLYLVKSESGLSDESVRASDVNILFDDKDEIVNPGSRLELTCGVEGKFRSCYWEKQDGQKIQVEDVHSNLISGMTGPERLSGNECGIVLNDVDTTDHGKWSCTIFVVGEALVRSKNVIVTITPQQPILEVEEPMIVDTKANQEITCSVGEARPKATITWYLDSEDISQSARSESTPTDNKNGIYKTISKLTRKFRPSDNNKRLICQVAHYTLKDPTNDIVHVDVRYAPVPKDVYTFYEINLGSEFELSVNFSSNPQPKTLLWKFGSSYDTLENTIPLPGMDPQGRYTARNLQQLPNGDYNAVLYINGFTEEDAKTLFSLTVENDLGTTDYQVRLSMDKAPRNEGYDSTNYENMSVTADDYIIGEDGDSNALTGGAVAGIVIVVVLVALVILIAGYARYNQMYCFATTNKYDPEKDGAKNLKEEHSDTESARVGQVTNKGQVFLKSINKNISSFKNRLSKKKNDDSKLNNMEEGTANEEENKENNQPETEKKEPLPQTDE